MSVVLDIGYAPNFSARALAARRTNTIGAIIPTMENAIFARGLQAFQEELANHGLTLLVASSAYSPELEQEQVRTLLARGADALLLIGFDRPEETLAYIRKRQVPAIVCWAYQEDGGIPSVGFDNRTAMKQLADQVVSLGHHNIAIISAPRRGNDRARDRVDGILEACMEADLDQTKIRIIETPYSIENGHRAARELLGGPHPPTVMMCGNDVLAVGATGAAKELGLHVPRDVSITGFDDIEIAEVVQPPLTTVHVPHRKMGKTAALQIVSLLTNAGAENCKLEANIVMRGSLGKAPN